MGDAERIVRVPLAVDLIRRMDELILDQKAGLRTRAEFIAEAVDALVLELSYEDAPPLGRIVVDGEHRETGDVVGVGRTAEEAEATDLNSLALSAPPKCHLVEAGRGEVQAGPLFGLHNRDFPSLWAARMLAGMTKTALVPLAEFLGDVTADAWEVGRKLRAVSLSLEDRGLAALFPTNEAKPQSAEEGFRAFAIGRVVQKGGVVLASGPLFQWQLSQLEYIGRDLHVGLTAAGLRILEDLEGLGPVQPHSPEHATRFLRHLEEFAPEDLWGFKTCVDAMSDGIGRAELVDSFSSARPDWSDKEAPSYAAGYVARSREWGLVHRRQDRGLYKLTELGEEMVEVWGRHGR